MLSMYDLPMTFSYLLLTTLTMITLLNHKLYYSNSDSLVVCYFCKCYRNRETMTVLNHVMSNSNKYYSNSDSWAGCIFVVTAIEIETILQSYDIYQCIISSSLSFWDFAGFNHSAHNFIFH